MPLDAQRIVARPVEENRVCYDARDTKIYALGIGVGCDPRDARALRYVSDPELVAFPTFAAVIGMIPLTWWIRDPVYGITADRTLAGEQKVVFHNPLPPVGEVRVGERVTAVVDKGAGRGALLERERTVVNVATNVPIATIHSSTFARGDGGHGGAGTPRRSEPWERPSAAADVVVDMPTLPNQNLIYCLSGDNGTIHWQPDAARAAGFDGPIMHGQCTFGIVAHALLRQFCDYEPSALREIGGRFSAVAYPGETVTVECWKRGAEIAFEASVRARGARILSNGLAKMAA